MSREMFHNGSGIVQPNPHFRRLLLHAVGLLRARRAAMDAAIESLLNVINGRGHDVPDLVQLTALDEHLIAASQSVPSEVLERERERAASAE